MQWKLPNFAPTNTAAKLDVLGITLLSLISGLFIYGVTEIRGTDAQLLGRERAHGGRRGDAAVPGLRLAQG